LSTGRVCAVWFEPPTSGANARMPRCPGTRVHFLLGSEMAVRSYSIHAVPWVQATGFLHYRRCCNGPSGIHVCCGCWSITKGGSLCATLKHCTRLSFTSKIHPRLTSAALWVLLLATSPPHLPLCCSVAILQLSSQKNPAVRSMSCLCC
jgi:hypothetical protein